MLVNLIKFSYVVARDHPIKSIEEYGQALAAKFLSEYSHVKKVNVEITEDIWERMPVNGKPHGHSFVKAMYVRTAKISAPRGAPAVVESGVRDLQVLKTTGSGFENFHRCRYTTLPDVADRLFGTKVQAVWTYTPEAVRGGYKSVDFNDTWNKVLALVFSTFATEYSPSVQRTIHSAGEKVVTRLAQVENITLTMPNIHNWTIDFTKLKLENTPDLLIPVDEPSGFIHATITKPKSKM